MPQDSLLLPPLAGRGRITLTERELREWGEKFGHAMRPPLLLAISGDLGAGKTTLVQSICAGYGVSDEVTSPTFALVQTYDAPASRVHHIDLYRIDKPADLTNLGWDDILAERAIVIVEWPDRAGDRLPADHIPIHLEYPPDGSDRRVLLAG